MDKEGFKLAFEEVNCQKGEREGLQIGWGRGEGKVSKRVDEKRAEVFEDKDGSPGHLRTWRTLVQK